MSYKDLIMKFIYTLSFSLLLLLAAPVKALPANDPYFHTVTAESGDGVYSLLRKYKLHDKQVNITKFYELNNLKVEEPLIKGHSYKLPVYIFTYNGKSIRSTIGIDDWDKAVRIKEYNEYLFKQGLRSTQYSESDILWVPIHELEENTAVREKEEVIAVENKNPTTAKNILKTTVSNSLFGKKYSDIPIEDHSLQNRVYYIVSGHGGPDPGTICKDCGGGNLCEDEYAYDVSLRLARNLMQHGATVEVIIQDKNDGIRDDKYLRCDKDEVLNNGDRLPINQVSRLNQRAFRVNELYKKYQKQGVKEQLMVAIHVDSRSKSHRQDVFFYHYPNSTSSKQLAEDVRDTFEEKYAHHQKNREYKGYVDERNLHVLRVTQPKAVFIELANIQNTFDHKRILISENRQALANWIFEAITKRVPSKSNQIVASS